MPIKHYRPTTSSRRNTITIAHRSLTTTSTPAKSLTYGRQRGQGRNSAGRITMRHKGGGHKRRQRVVDFVYSKVSIPAKVETLEYDPNRSGLISLVVYADGERRYHLLPQVVKVGDKILTSPEADLKPGNRLPLIKIPVGTFVYNLELKPGSGARLVRSAGVWAEVLAHDAGYTSVRLPSTEVRKILDKCYASIGSVSKEEHKLAQFGKAGRSRWKGIRPTVRGTAMNPVDHPHGGGEGVQGRGLRRAKTMWGKPSGKGQKTRRAKKYSNQFIVTRRRVGKKR